MTSLPAQLYTLRMQTKALNYCWRWLWRWRRHWPCAQSRVEHGRLLGWLVAGVKVAGVKVAGVKVASVKVASVKPADSRALPACQVGRALAMTLLWPLATAS